MRIIPSFFATFMLFAAPLSLHAEGRFTCADFEASVSHIDLETCPADLARDDHFCRVSFNNDALHVFVFSDEGERLLVEVATYFEDEFELTFPARGR